jgi:hypothetical protein
VSLAAQVEQSPKRTFSVFVPKIVPQDVVIEVEWRELRIHFTAPRGLKNLLFYEFDISATEGFFNLDRFASPETQYVFPALESGRTYYTRMRVVTKNGEVGPWSDTSASTTPLAQAFGLYDGREVETRVNNKGNSTWKEVYKRTYSAIGGKTYYAIDYEVGVFKAWNVPANVEWTDGIFRWMDAPTFYPVASDYVQAGSEFNVTSYSTNGWDPAGFFYVFSVLTEDFTTPLTIPGEWENTRRGTFVQKFHTISQGPHTFMLQARIIENHLNSVFKNDFTSSTHQGGPNDGESLTKFVYGADLRIKVKNFNIFEVLVSND